MAKFYLFKKMDIKFARNKEIKCLELDSEIPNFSSVMRFGFKLKDGKSIVPLDIDYELYSISYSMLKEGLSLPIRIESIM